MMIEPSHALLAVQVASVLLLLPLPIRSRQAILARGTYFASRQDQQDADF
jgi:hypothetical protein